jgi:hypothetical protein
LLVFSFSRHFISLFKKKNNFLVLNLVLITSQECCFMPTIPALLGLIQEDGEFKNRLVTSVRIAIISNTTNNRCWQGCGGKKEPSYTVGGNVD